MLFLDRFYNEGIPNHPGFCNNIHANFLQISALNNSIIISPIRLRVASNCVKKTEIRSTTQLLLQLHFHPMI